MSPIATALPPPIAEATESWYFPVFGSTLGAGQSAAYSNMLLIRSATIPDSTAPGQYGTSGGSGSSLLTAGAPQGAPARQECAECTTTVTAQGGGYQPTFVHRSYGPPADWEAGATQADTGLVSVYGVTWANSDAVDNWPDDTTGFCFCPNTAVMTDALRPRVSPMSGFGVFFNTDGAGGVQLDYLSWDGAAVVERVTLPAGIVPDITQWNSMRFILVSAASGREATASIEINSEPFVTARVFGSDIPLPSSQSATALDYVFANVALLGGGASYFFTAYGYDGRYKPNGEEIQPFGG